MYTAIRTRRYLRVVWSTLSKSADRCVFHAVKRETYLDNDICHMHTGTGRESLFPFCIADVFYGAARIVYYFTRQKGERIEI